MMTSSIEFVAEDGNEDIIKKIALAQVKQSYDWEDLKRILCNKLNTISTESEFIGKMVQKCIDQLNFLIETPFTVQRICELVLILEHLVKNSENVDAKSSKLPYNNIEKFMNAFFKCLNVSGRCDDITLSPVNNVMDTS